MWTYIKTLSGIPEIYRILFFQLYIYKAKKKKKITLNFLPFVSVHPHTSLMKLYL